MDSESHKGLRDGPKYMRTRWRRQEVKRGQYQRFKNVKGSVLFQRCFKERIWAFFINYQRPQREEVTGSLRRHQSFNIRNGKKAAYDKTKPPKRVGLPIPLQILQLEVRTREIHRI